MRFVLRSIVGLCLLAGSAGLIVYAWSAVQITMEERAATSPRRAAEERVFAVEVGRVALGRAEPVIEAYGEIRSWRTLELRAAAGGRIVELADRFRDGAEASAGDLLFRIDPEDFVAKVDDAAAALMEAEADLAEARQAIEVAKREMQAAETQRDLRAAALDRRAGLLDRGVSTSIEVEEAELALAAAEQSAASRAQATLAAAMRIERADLRRQRAEITLGDARRDLADIDHRAAFDGLLSDVAAVLGALVTPNERLGLLIDPTALEAVFRVTNAQYARLLDERGRLKPTPLQVTLELDETPLTVAGVVDRTSAVIDGGETGRLVYAKLDLQSATLLRPGDFVHVTISEPALDRVAVLPAAAVTERGELLVLSDADRLTAVDTRILRRLGDEVIVAGAPDGARYVKARAPQLGAGVKVRPLGDEPESVASAAEITVVELAPERKERLIGFVERSDQMSADMKMRVLSTLRTGRAPADLLERIERRMGDAG